MGEQHPQWPERRRAVAFLNERMRHSQCPPANGPILPPPKTRNPASIAMIAMAAMMTRARGTANLRILGICLETVARLCNHYGTMDTNTPAICVFCGSSHGVKPAYSEAASELGTLIGRRGYRFVFGGGDVGL